MLVLFLPLSGFLAEFWVSGPLSHRSEEASHLMEPRCPTAGPWNDIMKKTLLRRLFIIMFLRPPFPFISRERIFSPSLPSHLLLYPAMIFALSSSTKTMKIRWREEGGEFINVIKENRFLNNNTRPLGYRLSVKFWERICNLSSFSSRRRDFY